MGSHWADCEFFRWYFWASAAISFNSRKSIFSISHICRGSTAWRYYPVQYVYPCLLLGRWHAAVMFTAGHVFYTIWLFPTNLGASVPSAMKPYTSPIWKGMHFRSGKVTTYNFIVYTCVCRIYQKIEFPTTQDLYQSTLFLWFTALSK